MLRNVCDCCMKPMDGASADKEYNDLDLLASGEVVLSFEDLCPDCAQAISEAIEATVRRIRAPRAETPSQERADVPAPVLAKEQPETTEREAIAPEPKPERNDLPEKVTRRVPLPKFED